MSCRNVAKGPVERWETVRQMQRWMSRQCCRPLVVSACRWAWAGVGLALSGFASSARRPTEPTGGNWRKSPERIKDKLPHGISGHCFSCWERKWTRWKSSAGTMEISSKHSNRKVFHTCKRLSFFVPNERELEVHGPRGSKKAVCKVWPWIKRAALFMYAQVWTLSGKNMFWSSIAFWMIYVLPVPGPPSKRME